MPDYFELWVEEARKDEQRRREQQSGRQEITIFDGFGRRAEAERVEAWEQWFEYVDQVIWPIEDEDDDGLARRKRRDDDDDDENEVTF